MAALDFPTSPNVNDTYSANGVSYIWDGAVWLITNELTLGSNTAGDYVATGATSGNGISGSASGEGSTFTVTSNATDANTASTIVFRDGSGNFSAGTITATLSGTATNSTNAAITANDATNETVYITFADAQTGNRPLETDVGLTYNPNTNTLTTTTFSGALTGNADTATTATTATNSTNAAITANDATNETVYPTFADAQTGNRPLETDVGLTYNPSTNTLTTTTFSGALSGNATTATTATNSTNAAITANNTTNETVYITFADAQTGNRPLETDVGLTYNPSTGVLTSTSYAGDGSNLTGVVSTLAALTDTTITTPAANEYLRYTGATWVNDSNITVDFSFYENSNTISATYSIPTNYNAMSVGPIDVTGTITVPSGSTWVVI